MSATPAPAAAPGTLPPRQQRPPLRLYHPTVARLTFRALVSRRRALFLFALPALLLLMAAAVRVLAGQDDGTARTLLSGFALGTMVPLTGVIAGTGAIAPEIDDGSIVYLLAKPVRRATIVLTKLWIGIGVTMLFAALPTFFAGLILDGNSRHLAVAFGAAALIASVAYGALFLLLGIVTRHSVIAGLVYALVWESLVGSLVPGAGTLSVQQWALALAARVADHGTVTSQVGPVPAVVLLVVVTVAATWFAVRRLRALTVASDE
jgi:ABC-2 type transport system permease protein